jgi:hypothetical protein
LAQEGAGIAAGSDEVACADWCLPRSCTSSKSSRLPTLTGSRSNSAQSILIASESCPLSLGAHRHSVDNSMVTSVAGPAALNGYSVGSKAASASTPPPSEKPGIAHSFWTRLPDSGTSGGYPFGGVQALSRSQPRSNSLPPSGNTKLAASLQGLSVDGSAISVQRYGGVPAPRVKLRSARGLSQERPRAPAVCA